MNNLINFTKRYILFGWATGWGFDETEGTPCYIIGKEASTVSLVAGEMLLNVGNAIDIRYEWLDKTKHAFVHDQNMYIGEIENKPVYVHNVGQLFGEGLSLDVGSELWYKILCSHVPEKIVTSYEAYLEKQKSLPWLKIGIGVAIAILVLFLWQSGQLSAILSGVMPNVQPEPKGPVILP